MKCLRLELVLRRGFRHDVHPAAVLVERDFPIDQCEQGPIATGADILTGDKFRPSLANQDAARGHEFPAKSLYAEALADAVASVADAALTFLMCHKIAKL